MQFFKYITRKVGVVRDEQVVVMMVVTDGGGCDDDSDRW